MPEQWYISKDNDQLGPFNWEELKKLAQKRELSHSNFVWTEGMKEWIPAGSVEGLFQQETASGPPPLPSTSAHNYSSNQQMQSGTMGAPVRKKKSALKIAGIVGASIIVLIIVFVVIVLSSVRSTLRSSDIYNQAMNVLRENPKAIEVLGQPIEDGKAVNGSIEVGNSSGEADISIPVSGPIGKGDLQVIGTRTGGLWDLKSLILIAEGGEIINLLELVSEVTPDTDQDGLVKDDSSFFQSMETFSDPRYGFTMKYPQDWQYEISDDIVSFYGPDDNTIAIVLLLTEKSGGKYPNLQALYEDVRQIYTDIGGTVGDYESGFEDIGGVEYPIIYYPATYPGNDGRDYFESVIAIEYSSENLLQIIYTLPLEHFHTYHDIVFDEIIATFNFNNN